MHYVEHKGRAFFSCQVGTLTKAETKHTCLISLLKFQHQTCVLKSLIVALCSYHHLSLGLVVVFLSFSVQTGGDVYLKNITE